MDYELMCATINGDINAIKRLTLTLTHAKKTSNHEVVKKESKSKKNSSKSSSSKSSGSKTVRKKSVHRENYKTTGKVVIPKCLRKYFSISKKSLFYADFANIVNKYIISNDLQDPDEKRIIIVPPELADMLSITYEDDDEDDDDSDAEYDVLLDFFELHKLLKEKLVS